MAYMATKAEEGWRMRDTDTVENNCWSCGTKFEAAANLAGNTVPSEGDISICIMCSAPGVFNRDLSIRKPTSEEMERILKSRLVVKHMLAVRMLHQEGPAKR